MNRDEKAQEIERMKAELAKAAAVFVMNFEKIKVKEDYELRRQIRAAGGKYSVVKNTLAGIGAKDSNAEPLLKDLKGPTALVTTDGNSVALAKALTAYAKVNPNFTFRAGLVEGRVVSIREIADLATLPSKEELLAKVLYLLSSPARTVATTMQAVARNLASVLDEAVKAGKFSS